MHKVLALLADLANCFEIVVMSGREDRRLDSRSIHSRLDREPSPKRSRRDAKPETERPHTEPEPDKYRLERDDRQRRRPQDRGSKAELVMRSRELEYRADGHHGGTKPLNDSTRMPSSRSYFQHNNRDDAGHGRSTSRRTINERGWQRDPRTHQNERTVHKTGTSDAHKQDGMLKDHEKHNNHDVRHEGYFKSEANPTLSMHRRPSFRELKVPADPEKLKKASAGSTMPNPEVYTGESGKRASRHSYKMERPFAAGRGDFATWDRSGLGSTQYRGRERFNNTRQDYPPSGGHVEKWKHDLYNEANRSPTPKNEDDQISKIEALLAS